MKTIDKELMGQGYIEMGELNLSICNESFIAEHNAHIIIENNLKGECK